MGGQHSRPVQLLVTGMSGVGKTTLLTSLAGGTPPDEVKLSNPRYRWGDELPVFKQMGSFKDTGVMEVAGLGSTAYLYSWDLTIKDGRSFCDPLWRFFYNRARGVIFCVHLVKDADRIDGLDRYLNQYFIKEKDLLGAPVLVFANSGLSPAMKKSADGGGISSDDLIEALALPTDPAEFGKRRDGFFSLLLAAGRDPARLGGLANAATKRQVWGFLRPPVAKRPPAEAWKNHACRVQTCDLQTGAGVTEGLRWLSEKLRRPRDLQPYEEARQTYRRTPPISTPPQRVGGEPVWRCPPMAQSDTALISMTL